MNKVLVIIDMQNDFITGALGNKECEESVAKITSHLLDNSYDFIYLTRDTHQENYMETQEGKNLPVPHCIENTNGWEINSEVMAGVENTKTPYKIINKPTFGSETLGSEIKAYVAENEDTEITFVGVCTGICVISNAMIAKAVVPETKINVIADCCACVTPQSHETALEAMKLCQISIL